MKDTLAILAQRGSKAFKDLVIIAILIIALFFLAAIFEVSEDLLDWVLKSETQFKGFNLDEIFGLFVGMQNPGDCRRL